MKGLIIIGLGALIAFEYAYCVKQKQTEREAAELIKRYRESKDGRGIHSEE